MSTAISYSETGAKQDAGVKLDQAIFGVEANHELVAQAYRTYLANGRVAGATTLRRGEVRGGGKKPWRQKGTGRARVGSIRVPNWRGGGVVFGPTGNENHTLALPTKMKRQAIRQALAQDVEADDRVFICNEDSNTMSVIDPRTNTVESTINFTSFDEDPRPPFRYVTAGVAPSHAAMIHKPLYHGCIDAHGAVPSPDGRLLATSGRGSSNIYLIDAAQKRVIGNTPNPAAAATTNAERISTGILVGREPHEPTFSRNGKELWVTVRGEDRIAILDVEAALKSLRGDASAQAIRMYVGTLPGPAQVHRPGRAVRRRRPDRCVPHRPVRPARCGPRSAGAPDRLHRCPSVRPGGHRLTA